MDHGFQTELTSAEYSQLWGTFMGDSSQICMFTYFLSTVKDEEIKSILEDGYHAASQHVTKIKDLFIMAGLPVPNGFKIEEDLYASAPRLYSDSLVLEYLHQFGRIGLRSHAINLSLATGKECTDFFNECVADADRLYKMAKDLQLKYGIYLKSPEIKTSKKIDFIQHQSFLAGFFGDKRPLTLPETTSLYANFQRNALGVGFLIGLSQVAQAETVSSYFNRAKEIGEKHCKIFLSYLKDYNFTDAKYWDSEVSESKQSVFSDRLMMYIVIALTGASMGFYGLGLGSSFRRDLGADYNRLLLEVQLLAEDGANIMIENGWLESPPKPSDEEGSHN